MAFSRQRKRGNNPFANAQNLIMRGHKVAVMPDVGRSAHTQAQVAYAEHGEVSLAELRAHVAGNGKAKK